MKNRNYRKRISILLTVAVMITTISWPSYVANADEELGEDYASSIHSITPDEGGVSVSWALVEESSSYELYKKSIESPEYELVYEGEDTTYLDYDIEDGEVYTYYVANTVEEITYESKERRYCKSLLPVEGVEVNNDENVIHMKWNPVPGADGYKVVRRVDIGEEPDGSYSAIGSTEDTFYVDESVTSDMAGANASYSVLAYVIIGEEKVYSASAQEFWCLIKEPAIADVKWIVNEEDELHITWNPYEGKSTSYQYMVEVREMEADEEADLIPVSKEEYEELGGVVLTDRDCSMNWNISVYVCDAEEKETYTLKQAPLIRVGGDMENFSVKVEDVEAILEEEVTLEAKLNDEFKDFLVTYQWYMVNDSNEEEAEDERIEGATLATYTPDTSEEGSRYYYCKVTGMYGEEVTCQSNNACVTVRYSIDKAKVFYEVHHVYSGLEIEPEVVVTYGESELLVEGVDYEVSYESNIDAGTGVIVITGIGKYAGTLKKEYEIAPKSGVEFEIRGTDDVTYNGEEKIFHNISVWDDETELVLDKDYILAYESNINAGTAKVVVTFKGNYKDSCEKEYTILPESIDNVNVSVVVEEEEEKTEVTVIVSYNKKVLVENQDYTIDPIELPEEDDLFEVTIRGIHNFKDERVVSANKASSSIIAALIEGLDQEVTYTGTELEFEPVVMLGDTVLEEGIDYTGVYADRVNAGKHVYTVTGINKYSGTINAEYVINPASIEDVEFQEIERTYNGVDIMPTFEGTFGDTQVTFEEDYEVVSYENNTNVGEATAVIKGVHNFSGDRTLTFAIKALNLESASVSIDRSEYEFSGTAIQPGVTVTIEGNRLVKDKDYQVRYENNVQVGAGKVIVTGINNCEGEVSRTFTIKKTVPTSLSSSTVTVNNSSHIVSKITIGTNGSSLRNSFAEKSYVGIYNANGAEVDYSKAIGTGMKVMIREDGVVTASYQVVVTGDVNGDGKITLKDMAMVKEHYLGISQIKGIYYQAALIGNSDKVKLGDYAKIKSHYLGIEKITPR